MSATMSRSSVTGKPSSITNAADSQRGRAPEHGHVVDRAVHREVADRSAGEEAGAHDERVGAERQPVAARQVEARGVGQRRQRVVREGLEEHGVDQRRRRLAPGTVGQRDDLVVEPRPATPERLDALEHGGLADVSGHRAPRSTRRRWTRSQSSNTTALCASWIRCTLSDRTTRQWSMVSDAGHAAAVVARQPHAQEPEPARLGEGRQQVGRAAARREPERDVRRAGRGDQLAGEHEVEADVVGQRGQHGVVGDERARRQRPTDGRATEQRHHAGRVGGAAAVAEREEPPTRAKAAPPSRQRPHRARRRAPSSVASRSAALVLALASAERARSSSSGAGVALVALDEGVEEVGHGVHDRDRRAGVHEDEVARPDGPDQHRARRSRRRCGVRTVASSSWLSTTSPRRPSSEHVMQTSRPRRSRSRAARVLEADVGQLPQHVVAEHEPPVVTSQRVVAQPEQVVGGGGASAGSGAEPDGGETPRLGPPQRGADRRVGVRPRRASTSPARTSGRSAATRRRRATATAGRARVPTMTGWTNSTATCWACSGAPGAQHHSVAPAANRRASESAATARSAATSPRISWS